MTNEETAAAIKALPKDTELIDGWTQNYTGLTDDNLKALAESWKQQNAMLEAAQNLVNAGSETWTFLNKKVPCGCSAPIGSPMKCCERCEVMGVIYDKAMLVQRQLDAMAKEAK